jgi:hypothetical protein
MRVSVGPSEPVGTIRRREILLAAAGFQTTYRLARSLIAIPTALFRINLFFGCGTSIRLYYWFHCFQIGQSYFVYNIIKGVRNPATFFLSHFLLSIFTGKATLLCLGSNLFYSGRVTGVRFATFLGVS